MSAFAMRHQLTYKDLKPAWQQAQWPIDQLAGWIQQRFGRAPAQLTVEECFSIMTEFKSYAQQKLGGQ